MGDFGIIPAVDIRGGKCVRLLQGDYSREKIYSESPEEAAKRWDIDGVKFIHIIDLDGAKQGCPVNAEIIGRIASSSNASIEVGGGIRTEKDAEELLRRGVARVILGTSVCENPDSIKGFVDGFGAERIVAGIDARNGKAAVRGWLSQAGDAFELAAKFAECGVERIIYTDISTDGMLGGPNTDAVEKLCRALPGVKIISSGGVSSVADLRKLAELNLPNLEGAIVGKALYEGKFTVENAVSALQEKTAKQLNS